jgi:hypothetical protein
MEMSIVGLFSLRPAPINFFHDPVAPLNRVHDRGHLAGTRPASGLNWQELLGGKDRGGGSTRFRPSSIGGVYHLRFLFPMLYFACVRQK